MDGDGGVEGEASAHPDGLLADGSVRPSCSVESFVQLFSVNNTVAWIPLEEVT